MGNLTRRFQGSIDLDITEMGAEQLKCLAKRFENIHIDAVYSSPLIRAHKTALSVAEPKGLSVTDCEELTEINVGVIEDVPYDVFRTDYVELCDKWVNTPWEFQAPNGESMTSVYERMKHAITEIAAKNNGNTVLVASHGCAIRNLLAYVLFNDIKALPKIRIPFNTGVTKLIFDDEGNVTAEYCGDISHLPEEVQADNRVPQKWEDR